MVLLLSYPAALLTLAMYPSLSRLTPGGTLSGMLDASGGVAAMAFHYTVGHLASQDNWNTLLGILCLAALLGFFAMTTFQRMTLPPKAELNPWLRSSGNSNSSSSSGHGPGAHHRKTSSGVVQNLQALRWMLLGSVGASPAYKRERKDSTEVSTGGGVGGDGVALIGGYRGRSPAPGLGIGADITV